MDKLCNTATKQVLRLLAKDARLCLPLGCVEKILPLMMLETVPKSPPFVVGLMNVAGRSITVIDLAVRLGLVRNQAYTLDTPLVLCTQGDQKLVLLVDQVLGLADIEEQQLQTAGRFKKKQSPFLGSIVFEKEVFLLLNLNNIFDLNSGPLAETILGEHEDE